MADEKGFIGCLFDFSFTNFVTEKIIKILYVLAIVFSVLSGLAMLASGFNAMKYSAAAGMFQIILAPVVTFLAIVWSRIMLELVIVIFKIADNTTKMVKIKESEQSGV